MPENDDTLYGSQDIMTPKVRAAMRRFRRRWN